MSHGVAGRALGAAEVQATQRDAGCSPLTRCDSTLGAKKEGGITSRYRDQLSVGRRGWGIQRGKGEITRLGRNALPL